MPLLSPTYNISHIPLISSRYFCSTFLSSTTRAAAVSSSKPLARDSRRTMTTMNTTAKSNPFAPSSTTVNTSSASQSPRPVTLPYIRELYEPLDKVFDALIPNATPSKPKQPEATPVASNPFMDALKEAANRTTTTNNAAAYKSTLSPTLDAFASLSQSTKGSDISGLLAESWNADPAATLRIIWNLRSIHDGKSAREPFYRAFAWLYAKHPKTAVANLRYLVEPCVKRTIKRKVKKEDDDMEIVTMEEATATDDNMEVDPVEELSISMPHGYWKDLLNILLLATRDELAPDSTFAALHVYVKSAKPDKRRKNRAAGPPFAKPAPATETRLQKHQRWNDTVAQKLKEDKVYRALYVTVARLFADALARDIGILRQIADDKTDADRRIALAFELSLVGKWAPSIGGSHDRVTNIATPIAELLHAGGHFPLVASKLAQLLAQDVAHTLRGAYTRWALSPLRRFLQIPEIAMSARQWNKVKYTRVPSKCMQRNKMHFFKHDEERFSQYLMDVAKGKKKISGATLLPHELLAEIMVLDAETRRKTPEAKVAEMNAQVIEAQWNSLVARVKEAGTLESAIAVCDVSGSMGYIRGGIRKNEDVPPIFPAVALSVILSKVASPPWANHFITFSQSPEIIALDPDASLATTANKMVMTDWGMNTDFNAVFTKLILPMAVENKLKREDMVKRLFVFSDMQFDSSREGDSAWETEHQIIKKGFEAAGYEMPEIVYWNLNGDLAKPITADEEGVALVSGFSPGMLKVFLDQGSPDVADDEIKVTTKEDEDGEFEEVTKEKKKLDPVDTMLKALGKESFAGLVVLD